MDAQVRYPELFLEADARTPHAYWTSLRYFNLYRIALATLFFAAMLFVPLIQEVIRRAGTDGRLP